MQCNIDARGKAWRLALGLAMIAAAAIVCLVAERSMFLIVLVAILFAGGGLAIFEGWAGWCAVRAMGFRTRL
jgi:hypothetical protein